MSMHLEVGMLSGIGRLTYERNHTRSSPTSGTPCCCSMHSFTSQLLSHLKLAASGDLAVRFKLAASGKGDKVDIQGNI